MVKVDGYDEQNHLENDGDARKSKKRNTDGQIYDRPLLFVKSERQTISKMGISLISLHDSMYRRELPRSSYSPLSSALPSALASPALRTMVITVRIIHRGSSLTVSHQPPPISSERAMTILGFHLPPSFDQDLDTKGCPHIPLITPSFNCSSPAPSLHQTNPIPTTSKTPQPKSLIQSFTHTQTLTSPLNSPKNIGSNNFLASSL